MAKLRELEILVYILRRKSVTTSGLARDLNISLELAARWLGYFDQKGWLLKEVLPPYNGRFVYRLSRHAENIVQEVKARDDTWRKALWFGLGALCAIALTKGIRRKKPKGSQQEKTKGKSRKPLVDQI